MRGVANSRVGLAVAIWCAAALGLAGCDQRSERAERARDVIEGAVDQALGNTPPPDPLETVPLDARAFGGAEMADEAFAIAEARAARFAIGSIIAKPKELPPLPSPQDALLMQAPEVADELDIEAVTDAAPGAAADGGPDAAQQSPSINTRSLQSIEREPAPLATGELPDGLPDELSGVAPLDDSPSAVSKRMIEVRQSELRSLRQKLEQRRDDVQERIGGLPDVSLDDATRPEARIKLAKRALPTPETIERQVDARSKMLDVMAEFGLGGQIELNRTGEMVIQIGDAGADPTRQGADGAGGDDGVVFATVAELECPDNPDMDMVRANQALATECVVERLRETGNYEYVEKDFIFEHQFVRRPPETPVPTVITPDDPLWTLQWHFQDNGDAPGETAGGASFQDFWTRQGTQGSPDVVVAVVDTGLDLDHPDILDSVNVASGWDMVSDPRMGNDGDGRDADPDDPGDICDPTDPFAEDSFHGTHVAGTIGANLSNNRSGVAGGAWRVTVVPVRALGKCGGRLTDINDAIRWAGGLVPAFDGTGAEVWNENPADIINLSIGLFEFCPASLQDAINAVTERGVLVVSAAGNARVPTEFYSPGGCENVVTVAAGDARGVITPYSNYGNEVDVLAPGGDLTRDDNGDGRPDGVLSTKRATGCADPLTGESVATCNYAFEQGTSMAAPHVSAALALIKSKDPALFGNELRDRLLASLDARSDGQCAGRCDIYQGFPEIPGQPGQCARPCGAGLLNLANFDFSGDEGADD